MLKNYLKVAWKVLLRRKVFTFISLFGISVTLMVLTVATAMLDSVFEPRRPEVHADRMLAVLQMRMSGPQSSMNMGAGYGFLDRYVRDLPGLEAVSFSTFPGLCSSYMQGRKIESYLRRTDGQYWRILDFEFVEGGPYTDQDEQQGNRVAVINESTRARFFGGQSAVGKMLPIDGQSFRVTGVVRDVPFVRLVPFSDVWVPISTEKSSNYRHELVGQFMGLLLAPSVEDMPRIQSEFMARLKQVELPDKRFDKLEGSADTLAETFARVVTDSPTGDSHLGLVQAILFGLMVLFLLLPTVNLVNLNLSRILERSSEIGVRKAFGASSWTLVGQFLVENFVVTLLGALIGFALSVGALHALNGSGLIPYASFELNLRVFGEGLGIATFFSLMSGVWPAWRMSRFHPVEALRGRSL